MNNKKKIFIILIAVFLGSAMFFISDMIKYSSNSKDVTTAESEVKNSSSQENIDKNEENNDDMNKIEDKSTKQESTETTEDKSNPTKDTEKKLETTQKIDTKQEEKQTQTQSKPQSSKVIIKNEINGTTILSKSINDSNISVGEATANALDSQGIDYKLTGFGPTMYFASIAGLNEKAEGPTSGWAYYVQKGGSGSFIKPSNSCGSYKLQDGDVVLWKYVKDGV